jgi:hypothetical protein
MLDWLSGDLSDDLEVLVKVQDREPGKLRRRRDDEVGQGRSAMLASVSEQGEDLDRPVLDGWREVLDRHLTRH